MLSNRSSGGDGLRPYGYVCHVEDYVGAVLELEAELDPRKDSGGNDHPARGLQGASGVGKIAEGYGDFRRAVVEASRDEVICRAAEDVDPNQTNLSSQFPPDQTAPA